MTNFHLRPPSHHLFVQCCRAPVKLASHLFVAAWIIPQLVAAVGSAALRRTEIPERGKPVKSSSRSRVVIAILAVVGVVALIAMVVVRWQSPDATGGTSNSGGTTFPAEAPRQLEAWSRPTITDPRAFAIAYARAIWTYDTARHSYVDWQNAVSVFADPTSAAPQVARSLLPQWAEWDQLQSHKARAVARGISAEVTPELEVMIKRGHAPAGWHAYVVHGTQTVVTDADTRFLDRQAAVAVVCTPTCKFWSATSQVSP
ncbi:hypothetical protein [Kribbella sp. VKM Ac-2566]|uniref:hypothetical protein n=1 Tax=Kribbella sp. VKM Ac-2566 TaxID=2512218 RepID=UPI001062E980|nr:hypothetical protein [Kribbella sp. VKM Ac-2566]TDX04044.1 hypothetical protein EV647_2304 [Kribbella sp. VKM Ac-2566]